MLHQGLADLGVELRVERRGTSPVMLREDHGTWILRLHPAIVDRTELHRELISYAARRQMRIHEELRSLILFFAPEIVPDLQDGPVFSSLSPNLMVHFQTFLCELSKAGAILHLNRNRRVYVNVRHDATALSVVSMRSELLGYPEVIPEIIDLIHGRRRRGKLLDQAMQAIHWRLTQPDDEEAPDTEEGIGLDCDLEALTAKVKNEYFPALPLPSIEWSRRVSTGTLRAIRFAAYWRKPAPIIRVHLRLAQPWIAKIFLEHVLHHELCHHQQAHSPTPGESAHSKRFKNLERGYQHYERAKAWEKRNLRRLLRGIDQYLPKEGEEDA